MSMDPYPQQQPGQDPQQPGGQSSGGPQGQQPSPYGASQPGYGQQPQYDQQPQYGQTPYSPNPYGPPPAGGSSDLNVSALVLTILSALLTLSCYCTLVGIAPLILGIMGLVKQSSDPASASKLTKIGCIVFAVLSVLAIIAVASFFAWAISQDSSSGYDYDTY